MSFMSYIQRTERMIDGAGEEVIAQLIQDTEGGGPREQDNIATFLFFNHRRYTLGDRSELDYTEQEAFEHGGLKGLLKHLERSEGPILAHTLVGMYDHGGITIYPIERLGQHHVFDSGGWDSGCLGIAYVTQKQADEMGAPPDSVERQMLAEIEEYDDFLRGNVWGIVVQKPCPHPHTNPLDVSDTISDEEIAKCPHSEVTDSVWGYIGDPDVVWPEVIAEMGLIAPVA